MQHPLDQVDTSDSEHGDLAKSQSEHSAEREHRPILLGQLLVKSLYSLPLRMRARAGSDLGSFMSRHGLRSGSLPLPR